MVVGYGINFRKAVFVSVDFAGNFSKNNGLGSGPEKVRVRFLDLIPPSIGEIEGGINKEKPGESGAKPEPEPLRFSSEIRGCRNEIRG